MTSQEHVIQRDLVRLAANLEPAHDRHNCAPKRKPVLCMCGCGEPVNRPESRYVIGHQNRADTFNHYDVRDDGCWIWRGRRLTKGGYAQLTRADLGTVMVHRLFYEHFVGPIPEGLVIDHICRTRLCVNPEHMEPVTNVENVMRGKSFSAVNARKTHCIRGHEFTEANTFNNGGKRGCRTCRGIRDRAKRQNVDEPAVLCLICEETPPRGFGVCDGCREAWMEQHA